MSVYRGWVSGLALLAGSGMSWGQAGGVTFRLDGDSARTGWRESVTTRAQKGVLGVTRTSRQASSGLTLTTQSKVYTQFDATEWTGTLSNAGRKESGLVEGLRALDTEVTFPVSDVVLHHNVGSPADGNDYSPIETPLSVGQSVTYSGAGGRPTNSDLSYFNFAWKGGGVIVVIGWPGEWSATFSRTGVGKLKLQAGQQSTHFRLHPGESARTPQIVTMPYQGDWIDGQNKWRHWMMAYGMPKPGGQLPKPMNLASSSREYGEMIRATDKNQIEHIDAYLRRGLKLDYWWMDAGWYVQQRGWPQVGTWEADPKRFPNGFRPVSDHAHSKGVKTLVWFEPERVAPNTWLADNHPEWLLDPLKGMETHRSQSLGTGEPCVSYNTSDKEVEISQIHWKPKALSLHPGPKGEYCVVRWTAPSTGEYDVDATFAGLDDKTTTTDVHVLRNGASVFDGFINLNGAGRTTHYTGNVHLAADQYLDFVVGYGNGSYVCDTTGLEVEITFPNGTKHNASREYGGPAWKYGWLAPGDKPASSTFAKFDLLSKGGSGSDRLLDLGNPTAWNWLINHIDGILTRDHIDLYRQDFNIDPLPFWQLADTPDRIGLTENHYVSGFLAYWDELRRRHPNMLIDSCASGGRRNDLETMHRSVPLWRSDFAYNSIANQNMTYGLAMWLPYQGTGTIASIGAPYYGSGLTKVEPYAFWSDAAPSLGSGIDIKVDNIDWPTVRRLFSSWRQMSQMYYGDYFPLTPFSRSDAVWTAWQFNRPDKADGVVQAFRREKSTEDRLTVKLRGLDPNARYVFRALEGEDLSSHPLRGSDLMSRGLDIRLSSAQSAFVGLYSKVK